APFSAGYVTVDETPPTLELAVEAQPSGGQAVTATATTTDNDRVARVRFTVTTAPDRAAPEAGATSTTAERTTAPFTHTFNVPLVLGGIFPYVAITAEAFDAAGNSTTRTAVLDVQQQVGVVAFLDDVGANVLLAHAGVVY